MLNLQIPSQAQNSTHSALKKALNLTEILENAL